MLVERGAARGPRHQDRPRRTSLPKDRHLSTLAFLVARAVLTVTLGIVLSAWRWQRVLARLRRRRAAAHAHVALLRRPVRRERAAVDDRRRRAADQPVRRKDIGSSEVAFASVALERLSGFVALPLLVLPRLRRSTRRSSRVEHRLGRARSSPAARSPLLARDPAARRAAPSSRAGSRTTRTGCGSSAPCTSASTGCAADPRDALGILGAALVYQVSVVAAVVLRGPHARRSRSRPARSSRSSPRSRWRRCCRSRSAGSASVKACSCCCCTRSASRPGRPIALGLLWYAMMLVVSLLGAPAFAVGHRGTALAGGEPRPRP